MALVVALVRLLAPGGDGGGDGLEQATTASATTGRAGAGTGPARRDAVRPRGAGTGPDGRDRARAGAREAPRGGVPTSSPRRRREPLAEPEGRCPDEDVRVVPEVVEAVGGDTITIRLVLRTVETEACWWMASPRSLTMRVTSGRDEIWTSQDCPGALPRRSLVLRRAVDTVLLVGWSGRRSDDECSRLTEWALPGFYHVEAAALAGEPADVQFELTAPEPEVITQIVGPRGGRGRR